MYTDKQVRHNKQRLHEGSYSLENKLMDYLRNNYNVRALRDINTQQTIKKDLVNQAKKIDLASGKQEDMTKDYMSIVEDIIQRYVTNQSKPACKRADQLGVRQDGNDTLNNITRTISQLRC